MRRLLNSAARVAFWKADAFRKDERGSISIQMIIYSLLLLMSTGLVLDSGRVFTQHSQMQAFTDQMAIAAASELDGQQDAVERAVNAVFGLASGTPLLRKAGIEYGEFGIQFIGFYSAMAPTGAEFQPDMTKAFPASALVATAYPQLEGGAAGESDGWKIEYAAGVDADSADGLALYAVVGGMPAGAESVTVGVLGSVQGFIDDGEGDGTVYGTPGVLGFGSVAAATLADQSCSELSTVVFCDPWADQGVNPFDTSPDDLGYSIPGRSLMTFAPNYDDPTVREPALNGTEDFVDSFFPWDVDHQIFHLTDPLADSAGVCDSNNVPRLSGEDYLVARDRCLMARAQQDQVCWSGANPLKIAPAHGPSVSRAINTMFDIWIEPMDDVIVGSATVGATGMSFQQFFEPDTVVTTIYDTADWYQGSNPGTMQDGDAAAEYAAMGNAPVGAYFASTLPDYGMTPVLNASASGNVDACHLNTYIREVNIEDGVTPSQGILDADCDVDFVGNYYDGASLGTNYPDAQMEDYWTKMYRPSSSDYAGYVTTFCDSPQNIAVAESVWPGYGDFCSLATAPGVDTWYELYQQERTYAISGDIETRADDRSQLAANNGRWCNAAGPNCGGNKVERYGLSAATDPYIKMMPDDYLGAMSGGAAADGVPLMFQSGQERRRIRAAVVNCRATVANVNPDGSFSPKVANDDGSYDVADQDLRIVDIFVPMPAVHDCGLSVVYETDADGNTLFETDADGNQILDVDGNPIPVPASVQPPAEERVQRCEVDDSKETQLFIELIKDVTPEVTRQYTAYLVR